MDRRDALRSILAALTVAPPFLGRSVEALAREAEILHAGAGPYLLTTGQLGTVGALVDTIIPKTATPGALDAGAHRFVDAWLASAVPEVQATFVEGLRRLDRAALKRCGGYFRSCAERDRVTLLEAVAGSKRDDNREFFRVAKSLTVFAFYTSAAGMNEIGWTDHHHEYQGCTHDSHRAGKRP